MDARKKEIEHLEGEIRRLDHQITAECVEIAILQLEAEVFDRISAFRTAFRQPLQSLSNLVGSFRCH